MNSKFLRYMSWWKAAQSVLLERPSKPEKEIPLFPAAAPYPEVLHAKGCAVVDAERPMVWAKQLLNSRIAWSNYVVLGCPDCRGGACEPRVVYRCWRDARTFADRLLGEVVEFMDETICTESLTCDGKRVSIEEALAALAHSHACYGVRPAEGPQWQRRSFFSHPSGGRTGGDSCLCWHR